MRGIPAKVHSNNLMSSSVIGKCSIVLWYNPYLICIWSTFLFVMFIILQIERRTENRKYKKEHRIINLQFILHRTLTQYTFIEKIIL